MGQYNYDEEGKPLERVTIYLSTKEKKVLEFLAFKLSTPNNIWSIARLGRQAIQQFIEAHPYGGPLKDVVLIENTDSQ